MEALKYFEQAAGIGPVEEGGDSRGASNYKPNAQAKYQLGVMYYDGLGVQENPVSSPSSKQSSPSPFTVAQLLPTKRPHRF